jgi:WD40 repeat protein
MARFPGKLLKDSGLRVSFLMLSLLAVAVSGCGESEDFSKPLPQAQALNKPQASEQSPAATKDKPAAATEDAQPQGDTPDIPFEVTKIPTDQSEQATPPPADDKAPATAATQASPTQEQTPAESTTDDPTPEMQADDNPAVAATEQANSEQSSSETSDKPLLFSASDSKDSPAADKPTDSGKTTKKPSTGLFPKAPEESEPKKVARRKQDDDDAPVLAADQKRWLLLTEQLSDRFRSAVSIKSRFAVATADINAVEVVNFDPLQIDDQRQRIDELTYSVESVTILDDRPLVLIGTKDGEVATRRFGVTIDSDVYATDLQKFLDENRALSVVGTGEVRLIQPIANDRILTLTADDSLRIWNTQDLVNEVTPIDQMTVEGLKQQKTRQPSPLADIKLPGSGIVGFSVAEDGDRIALVLSDATVVVASTVGGRILQQLDRTVLDVIDQDLPSAVLLTGSDQILIGTIEGRVMSAQLAGDSITDKTLFIDKPERRKSVAVTAVQSLAETDRILVGTEDGSLTEYNLQGEVQKVHPRPHSGAVLDIVSTERLGRVSRGIDRAIFLADRPIDPNTIIRPTTHNRTKSAPRRNPDRIEMAKDVSRSTIAARRDAQNQRAISRDKHAAVEMNYRPEDPELALLLHQLRTTSVSSKRVDIQKQIITRQQSESIAETAGKEVDSGSEPVLVNELKTPFVFDTRQFRQILLSVSNDGRLASATPAKGTTTGRTVRGAPAEDPLIVWDVASLTELRRWYPESGSVDSIHLQADAEALITSPVAGRYSLLTGELDSLTDNIDLIPTSFAFSPDRSQLAVGLMTLAPEAVEVICVLDMFTGTKTNALTAYETVVPALNYAPDGSALFASVREGTRSRTLELDPLTLQIRSTIHEEANSQPWTAATVEQGSGALGTTFMLSAPGGKLMLTHGQYDSGDHVLRVWKRRGSTWPEQDALVSAESQPFLSPTHPQATFVNGSLARIALHSEDHVRIFETRDGKSVSEMQLPEVSGRPPMSVFTPDGRWMIVGDGNGTLWARRLTSLERGTKEHVAQAGPIVGMAVSANGRYLATIGEENLLRIWRIDGWLK